MYKGTRQGENLGSCQISIELLATELKLYETAIFCRLKIVKLQFQIVQNNSSQLLFDR